LSLIRDLYGRFREIGAEGIRFCIVGGAGFVLQLVVQDLLHLEFGVEALTGVTIGTACGLVLTFFGSRYWTFASKRSRGKEAIRESLQFLFWGVVGWAIQEGIQAATYYGLGLKSGLAYSFFTCVGVGVATIFRFWAYRTFVFTGQSPAPAAEPAEELEPEPAP
jgi:putative flippase GtrA